MLYNLRHKANKRLSSELLTSYEDNFPIEVSIAYVYKADAVALPFESDFLTLPYVPIRSIITAEKE